MKFERSIRVYRRLLRALPADFRERYEDDLVEIFGGHLEAAGRRWGRTGIVFAWGRALWDLTVQQLPEAFRRRETSVAFSPTAHPNSMLVPRSRGGIREFVSTTIKDVRIVIRTLGRDPAFAGVVILILGLGIGSTAAIFSVVNGVLLQPLPYQQPDQLALIMGRMTETSVERAPFSGPDLVDIRERSSVFEEFSGIFSVNTTVTGDFEAEQIRMGQITTNFFSVLGVSTILGRGFTAEDQQDLDPSIFNDPSATPPQLPVILGHGLWERRFGSSRDAIGQVIQVNGQDMYVIGVAPPDLRLLMPSDVTVPATIDLWSPFPLSLNQGTREAQWLTVMGRLREGATWEQAQGEMDAIAAQLRAEQQFHENVGLQITVAPLHDDVVQHVKPVLMALLGAVGFVLLIACANVANLLMIRAQGRQREIAIRAALGGGRARIVRQVMTDSLVLAFAGGLLGLALAAGGVEVLLYLRPENLPRAEDVGLDGSVLAFAMAVSFLAALLFGMVPAMQASRPDLTSSLKERNGTRGAPSGQRLRGALVVGEVALSLVLLIGAGLMLRSFSSLRRVEPGFDASSVLTAQVAPPFFSYRTPEERVGFFRAMSDRLGQIPGVETVGGVTPLPLAGLEQLWFGPYAVTEDEEEWSRNEGDYRIVVPGYFETVGASLLQGRALTWADHETEAQPVVVVDNKLAEAAWPGEDPLGREILVMRPSPADMGFARYWATVVGVVDHVRHASLTEDGRAAIYFPVREWPGVDMGFTLKTSVDPASLAPAVRQAVAEVDPSVAAASVRPFEAYVTDAMAPTRFALLLIATFAGVALVLALVGLYGVMSYSVRERVFEIGVRMAFGAGDRRILNEVLAHGMRLTLIGVGVGVVGALALTQILSTLLVGVSPTDPATFAVISLLLTGIALIASYAPARRATRVDPLQALRAD